MYFGYAIMGIIALIMIRKYVRFKFDKTWASRLMRYSNYTFLAGFSSVFYHNIDKILINKYMNVADVGLYVVYNYSFTFVIAFSLGIFEIVFFPFFSKYPDKQILLNKINKIVPLVIVFGYPIFVCMGFLILKLYGPNYPFELILALLFGFVGIGIFLDKVYGLLLSSIGIKGRRIVSIAAIILAFSNIFLNIILIPIIGLQGAIIATIISFFISFIIMFSKRKYVNIPEVI